ncbi:serine/threonine-protein phosphatase 4 regulatory subunit 2 [Pelobates fuscus]|uniref:serine/threonine-protein phosphatase 4 regulatory subunit 2 n=1 Tax=Pelobates fuscus TaxID=191477 RepID=UPI002FE43ABF
MDVDRLQEALKEFEKRGKKEASSELDQFLCHVAKTGETIVQWPLFKEYFMFKLEKVMDDFRSSAPEQRGPPNPNVEYIPFDEMKDRILKIVTGFNGTPFTIQRLCELVTDPRRNYTGTDKFLRGVEKNVMVVSCVYPTSEKNNSTSLNRMNGVMFPSNSQNYTDRSNVNGPGTPRPVSRPKLSLSTPMTTNGLPDSSENKESDLQQKEKDHSECLLPEEDSPTCTVKNKHSEEEDPCEVEEHEVKRLKFDPEDEDEDEEQIPCSQRNLPSDISADMTEEAESVSATVDKPKESCDSVHTAEELLMTASESSEEDEKDTTEPLTVSKEESDESHHMEETENTEEKDLQTQEQEKPSTNAAGAESGDPEPSGTLEASPETSLDSMENSEEATEVADEPMEQD